MDKVMVLPELKQIAGAVLFAAKQPELFAKIYCSSRKENC